jgi:hypothetical protein
MTISQIQSVPYAYTAAPKGGKEGRQAGMETLGSCWCSFFLVLQLPGKWSEVYQPHDIGVGIQRIIRWSRQLHLHGEGRERERERGREREREGERERERERERMYESRNLTIDGIQN